MTRLKNLNDGGIQKDSVEALHLPSHRIMQRRPKILYGTTTPRSCTFDRFGLVHFSVHGVIDKVFFGTEHEMGDGVGTFFLSFEGRGEVGEGLWGWGFERRLVYALDQLFLWEIGGGRNIFFLPLSPSNHLSSHSRSIPRNYSQFCFVGSRPAHA